MRKIFALLILASFSFHSIAQIVEAPVPPVPPAPKQEMNAEQQKAYDDAMMQLNNAIQNLNQSLKKIDSMSANGYRVEIPAIPPIPPMPKIGKDYDADVVIKIMEDSLDRFEDAMELFEDSLEVALGRMKIEINEDGDKRVVIIDRDMNDVEDIEIDTVSDEDACDKKTVETKMFGLDLGVSAFLDNGSLNVSEPNHNLELTLGKSMNVNLHVFHQSISFIKHHFSFNYGLYFELNNYRFANDALLIPKVDTVGFMDEGVSYRKNKLFTSYLNLPVTLNFESNPLHPKKSFNLSVGGYGGYLVGAHTKTVKSGKEINKKHDDFNLSKLHYGLTARIGYSWFNLYVTYAMTPLFNEGVEPALTPVSAGIALIGF